MPKTEKEILQEQSRSLDAITAYCEWLCDDVIIRLDGAIYALGDIAAPSLLSHSCVNKGGFSRKGAIPLTIAQARKLASELLKAADQAQELWDGVPSPTK